MEDNKQPNILEENCKDQKGFRPQWNILRKEIKTQEQIYKQPIEIWKPARGMVRRQKYSHSQETNPVGLLKL